MHTLPPPRPITPGSYSGEVIIAELASLEWRRSDRNPRGLVARIAVEIVADGEIAVVFDGIDIDRTDRLDRVFAAAGVARRGDEIGRDLEDLVGCDVQIVTKNVTPTAGRGAGKPKGVIASWIVAR